MFKEIKERLLNLRTVEAGPLIGVGVVLYVGTLIKLIPIIGLCLIGYGIFKLVSK